MKNHRKGRLDEGIIKLCLNVGALFWLIRRAAPEYLNPAVAGRSLGCHKSPTRGVRYKTETGGGEAEEQNKSLFLSKQHPYGKTWSKKNMVNRKLPNTSPDKNQKKSRSEREWR